MFAVFVIFLNSVFKAICLVMLAIGLYNKNTNVICKSKKRLDGKTVIVTGGTSGIGLEISKDLALRGAKVIIAGPDREKGNIAKDIIENSGNTNVKYEPLDLSSFANVRKFASAVIENEDRLDILMNNASVGISNEYFTEDKLNSIMQVNYFGTVLLTLLLLPLMKKSGDENDPSKIVNTTSMAHFLGLTNFRNNLGRSWLRYTSSKLCIALFSRELAKRMQSSDVVVNIADPGIFGSPKLKKERPLLAFVVDICFKNAWEAAQTSIFASVNSGRQNGKYFRNCEVATTICTPFCYDDDEKCRVVWEKTMDFVKVEGSVLK